MRRLVPLTTLTALVACVALPRGLAAQETAPAFEARVWLDRGAEPVLRRGEDVRVFYRTNEDAFAAIFRIDTDGRVHLIYPQHPDAIEVVRADRDYRLVFPHSPVWRVSEDPGVGYLFIVASPEPLDLSSFPYDEYHGWELSAVGDVVYTDPYVAIDDYVARIIPDWEQVPYALDFVTYSVGETYSYPRFLCYDCHTYQAYSSWNPYDYTCSTFRVVIWDDPYFYPRYRYSGVNVVVVQRPVRAALPRYEVTRRVVGDAVRPIVRTRAVVEYKEPATARGSGRVATTPAATRTTPAATRTTPAATRTTPAATRTSAAGTRTSTVAPRATAATSRSASALSSSPTRTQVVPQERPQERPRTGPQEAPDTTRSRPTLQRRPSSRLPVRTPPSRDPQQPSPTPSPSATPSRLPARTPAARPDASPARPSDPSGASARPTAPSSRQSSPSGRSVPSSGRDAPAASPSRPPARVTPAPSSARPSTGSSRPQAAPSRPQAAPSRPQAAPSRSSGSSGGGSRPSASPAPSRSSEPRSEPRSSDSRPSVRARPASPR